MPNWIRKPGLHHFPNLQRHFYWRSDPGRGFMFDVDADTRQVILTTEKQRQNYALAQKAVQAGSMIDDGITDFGTEDFDPGAIRCACERVVELVGDWQGTRCACGREYGSEGQEFRANWREVCRETGELQDDDFA